MQKGGGLPPAVGVLGRRPDGYMGGEEDDRAWMCGTTDLPAACRLIGVLELLATALAFALLILFYCVFYSDTYAYQLICGSGSLAVGICCCAAAVVVVGSMYAALRAESAPMLLLHVAGQVLALILMGFAGIVGIVLLIGWSEAYWGPEVYLRPSLEGRVQDQYAAQKTAAIIGGIVLAMCIVGFLLESYFLMIVLKTYRMLAHQNNGNNGGGGHVIAVY